MSFGPMTTMTKEKAAAGSHVVFTMSKAYSRVYLSVPSLTTNAELDILGSINGTDYFQFMFNSNIAAPTTMYIATTVTGGCIVELEAQAPYIKVLATQAACGAVSYNLICID